MKKFLAFTLAFIMLFGLFGCGAKEDPNAEKSESKGTIACVIFQDDITMHLLQQGMIDAATAAGYDVLATNVQGDQGKEVEFINTCISQGVDGICINPLSAELSYPMLKTAAEAGIKVIICDREIDGAEEWAVGAMIHEQYQLTRNAGLVAADFIKNNLGGKAVFGVVDFQTQVPVINQQRLDGFFEALEENGVEYEIVADQEGVLADAAQIAATDIITSNSNVNCLFGASEQSTIGCSLAVENAGLQGKVFVFGTDISAQTIDLLKDSKNILQVTTGQNGYNEGTKAVNVLIDAIEGRDVSEYKGVTTYLIGDTYVRGDEAAMQGYLDFVAEKVGSEVAN